MAHRILIADDSPDTLGFLTVFLGFSGWEVVCVSTLAEAKARLDVEPFDLVILDRWFADQDGIELCRALKLRLPELPVVFLSGAALPDDVERATDAGCSAYLIKPCDMDELTRVVEGLLSSAAPPPPSSGPDSPS
jgi:DNA-binding response OmpR family regulator